MKKDEGTRRGSAEQGGWYNDMYAFAWRVDERSTREDCIDEIYAKRQR